MRLCRTRDVVGRQACLQTVRSPVRGPGRWLTDAFWDSPYGVTGARAVVALSLVFDARSSAVGSRRWRQHFALPVAPNLWEG